MKTIAHRLALVVALFSASSPSAQPLDVDEQLKTFATCVGRLSAVMEHQWMFDGPASEHTEELRDAVLELVEAVMPTARGDEVLQWRISAKVAQAALLRRATFNTDTRDAAWAHSHADRLARDCTGLLLS
ncbi:hypothetical protein [Loktanella sp. 5RATIMAR09]|uniref:hypothetical protein n=1 Tax=Loktanella sp. 5RATIMAR09 TaxID=1225655 RepID=UPI000B28A9A7|nr:hypothetical protein [Loktanella sp. 5RATIMAR09]